MGIDETTIDGRPLSHYTAGATALAAVFFIALHSWLDRPGAGLLALGFLLLAGNLTVRATGAEAREPVSQPHWRRQLALDSVLLFAVLVVVAPEPPGGGIAMAVGPFAVFLVIKDAIEGILVYADHLPAVVGIVHPSTVGHLVGVAAGLGAAVWGDVARVLVIAIPFLLLIWLAAVWPAVEFLRVITTALDSRFR